MHLKFPCFVCCLTGYCYCFEQPKFVVHCAAERRPDVMAKNVEASRELNIDATHIVSEEAGTYCQFVSCIVFTFPAHNRMLIVYYIANVLSCT